jgi:hypothetical protein
MAPTCLSLIMTCRGPHSAIRRASSIGSSLGPTVMVASSSPAKSMSALARMARYAGPAFSLHTAARQFKSKETSTPAASLSKFRSATWHRWRFDRVLRRLKDQLRPSACRAAPLRRLGKAHSSSTSYSGQRASYAVVSGNCAASRSRVRSMLGPVLRVKPISRSTHLCRNRLASQVSLTSVPEPTGSSS